jgi:hypothetical protein
MGEYEPNDSRNITGTATTPDGRWTNKEGKPPTGVPDDNPADAADATIKPGSDAQPSISDEPSVPDRDELPGTPRPADRPIDRSN